MASPNPAPWVDDYEFIWQVLNTDCSGGDSFHISDIVTAFFEFQRVIDTVGPEISSFVDLVFGEG